MSPVNSVGGMANQIGQIGQISQDRGPEQTAKGAQDRIDSHKKDLQTHEAKLSKLSQSSTLKLGGAARAFAAFFSGGITEIRRADVTSRITKMQATIVEDKRNITRAQSGLRSLQGQIRAENQALCKTLSGNKAIAENIGAAVAEAFQGLHEKFGDDIMPNLNDLKGLDGKPEFKELLSDIQAGFTALPERATPQDIKDIILSKGQEFMAGKAFNSELENVLHNHGFENTSPDNVQSSFGLSMQVQLEECSDKAGVLALVNKEFPKILQNAEVCNLADRAQANALDSISNTLSEKLNLPKESIEGKLNLGSFEQKAQMISSKYCKEAVTAETGAKIEKEFAQLAQSFTQGKIETYLALDAVRLPESSSLKEQWQNTALSSRGFSQEAVVKTADLLANNINMDEFKAAITAEDKDANVATMLEKFKDLIKNYTENLQNLIMTNTDKSMELDREQISDVRNFAMGMAFARSGVDQVFAKKPELLQEIATLAQNQVANLSDQVKLHPDNEEIRSQLTNIISTTTALHIADEAQRDNKQFATNFRAGLLPIKHDAAFKEALVELSHTYPDDKKLTLGDTKTAIANLPTYAIKSVSDYMLSAKSHITPKDFGALIKNAYALEKKMEPLMAASEAKAKQAPALIAAGIGMSQIGPDEKNTVEKLLTKTYVVGDCTGLVPAICREKITPDPKSLEVTSLFEQRVDSFIQNKTALLNSVSDLALSASAKDFLRMRVLEVEGLKNPDFLNNISAIVDRMGAEELQAKLLDSDVSQRDKALALIAFNERLPELLKETLSEADYSKLDVVDTENANGFASHMVLDRNPSLVAVLNSGSVLSDLRNELEEMTSDAQARMATMNQAAANAALKDYKQAMQPQQFLLEFDIAFAHPTPEVEPTA